MENAMDVMGAGGGLFVFALLVTLAILWFVLPFAIFGTKPILRQILEVQLQTLNELRTIRKQIDSNGRSATSGLRASPDDSFSSK